MSKRRFVFRPIEGPVSRPGALCVAAACLWLVFGADIARLFPVSPFPESVSRSRTVEASSWPRAAAPVLDGLFFEDAPAVSSCASAACREVLPGRWKSIPGSALGGAPTGGEIAFIHRAIRTLSPLCRLAWG